MTFEEITLSLLIFLAAILYSSVGHAGASGYLAAMALFGLPAEVMRPSALFLNILVAALATYKYTSAKQNDLKLLVFFVITSIPAAYLGGMIHVPSNIYKQIIGVILMLSAVYMVKSANKAGKNDREINKPHPLIALVSGGLLGFLAGISGTGGGIFLSPLLIIMGWASTRNVSGIAASFILLNSISGLMGNLSLISKLPTALPYWGIAAVFGGIIGSYLGTRKLTIPGIRYLLSLVLIIASVKMFIV